MEKTENQKYHLGRLKRIDYRYRLNRRSTEVIKAIKKHSAEINKILDLGSADGLMLSKIKKEFPKAECLGIDSSKELLETNKDNEIQLIHGDVHELPFDNNQFDVVIAAAIIEHLDRPTKLISESQRVLKNDGLFIITTPDPYLEKIWSFFNPPHDGGHQTTFNLKKLKKKFIENNLSVLEAKKFMITPIGFPAEPFFEKILNSLKINFTLINQIIVGKKLPDQQ